MTLTLDDYDFDLPEASIAQYPAPERSASRLLIWKADGSLGHGKFTDIVATYA